MKNIKINKILEFLDSIDIKYKFNGNLNDVITNYSSLYEYKSNTITWAREFFNLEKYLNCDIKCIILPNSCGEKELYFENIIYTDNPHKVFFYILDNFFTDKNIHLLGSNNVISSKAKIGYNVNIGNNCTIEDGVEIGDNTIILNNVVISKSVKIGSNCVIKSGAVIGEYGLGYIKEDDGSYRRVPHLGSVIIGNNVDIGANTTIERGVMEDTVIDSGVKIDDLCQISHNVKIGKNTMIVVNTSIYGSVKIGQECWIASSIIRNQVVIGDNVTIGMGSVVTKDISSNMVVYGNPAREKL